MEEAGYTIRENQILKRVKDVMPLPFLSEEPTEEILNRKVLGFAQLVLDDINAYPPASGYTIENSSGQIDSLLVKGVMVYTTLFMAMKWTMNDFAVTDNGLSLTLDRVEKLNKSWEMFYEKHYLNHIKDLKASTEFYYSAIGMNKISMLSSFIRVSFGFNV
jgi:hypothetical protein